MKLRSDNPFGKHVEKGSFSAISKADYHKIRGIIYSEEIDFIDAEPLSDEIVANSDDRIGLRNICAIILRSMKKRERLVAHMVFMCGYTYKEAGLKLGISTTRVQQIFEKGARRFRSKYKLEDLISRVSA